MSGQLLVSVIVPNYNYEKTLGRCLDAVFAQTYRPVEVIVVDDRSTDRSPDIARGYPCTLIENVTNLGPSASRNRGVAASRGQLLFFLDSDVALAPDAVENAVRILRERPEVGCVSGIYAKEPLISDGLLEDYRVLHGHYWRRSCEGPVRTGFFSLGAVRREAFDAVGPFDENLRATEDVEYGNRLSRRYPMLLSARIVGRHDDDHRLGVLIRKQYERSLPLVSMFMHRRKDRPGLGETANRPGGVLSATLSLLSSPAGLAWAPLWVLPFAFVALFALSDRGLARFVLRERGWPFFLFFVAVHLTMNLTLAVAAAVGAARWLLSPRFRRIYDRPARVMVRAPEASR